MLVSTFTLTDLSVLLLFLDLLQKVVEDILLVHWFSGNLGGQILSQTMLKCHEQLCVNYSSPVHYLLLVRSHSTILNTINVLTNTCLVQMVNDSSEPVFIHLKKLIIPFY
jgi:hypothetical protein